MNKKQFAFLHKLSMRETLEAYKDLIGSLHAGSPEYWEMVAALGKYDRFFLLTHVLNRFDVIHPWLYNRCREVEENPDGNIDLWSREHYKSTIITFAGIIQEIIKNPEITICILSYNNATATDFMAQIKRELEGNQNLKDAYSHIFYDNPKKDAKSWSLDKGLIVKRKTNPKEPTLNAFGLVDNQPTGRHFMLRVYDDVVTRESVTTPEMIHKVTEAWELSLNLGAGRQGNRQWYVGTRYSADDTYKVILDRQVVKPRIYPATDDGTPDGNPVFMDRAEWEELKQNTSDYILACQRLLNPLAGSLQEFKMEWVRKWDVRPGNLNVAIMVDPASSKKGKACNTAMTVIGVDTLHNKYLLDGFCHKMDLNERWENLKKLRQKWVKAQGIQTVTVGYEKYGMQSDIEHFHTMMKIENNYFSITPVSWTRDGLQAKDDRIRRLIPDHKNGSFFYPETEKVTKKMREAVDRGDTKLVAKPIRRIDHNGRVYELTDWFLRNEYPFFPNSQVKDMLDCMSRVYDLEIGTPIIIHSHMVEPSDNYMPPPSFDQGMALEPEGDWI
jgi:hypothetical protein